MFTPHHQLSRKSHSGTTKKSYDRAIAEFTQWAHRTVFDPNPTIVTPDKLLSFLNYLDQFRWKRNGDKYSFSYYEQHVSSIVILYEQQKEQFKTRPKIVEDENSVLNNGEWQHPRDKRVREFMKMIKNRSKEDRRSVEIEEHKEETRLNSIEEHLRIQADSITRTNALLSLYHNDLQERSGHLTDFVQKGYDLLTAEVENVKKMINYLITVENRNAELIVKLIDNGQHVSPLVPAAAAAAAAVESSSPEVVSEEIPKITLRENKDLTLRNLYQEYAEGYMNQPSLKSMELKYKTRWRIHGKNNKTIMRRLKVGLAIDYGISLGKDVDEILQELDEYLIQGGKKKKSTYWLSENLPLKYVN